MEQILEFFKDEKERQNELNCILFEYLTNQMPLSDDANNKLASVFFDRNSKSLIRLDLENGSYYILEEELSNKQISLFKLNKKLADLKLVGIIENGEITFY